MSVTAAEGFSASGIACGIKPEALDLAVVVAAQGAVTAGVFTQNRFAAAPVVLNRASLSSSHTKYGIVINSGNANAVTGEQGHENAAAMARTLAAELGCEPSEVLVCSTGGIGSQLPMDVLLPGIPAACVDVSADGPGGTTAATAIMTTDSHPKESSFQGNGWVVGGMAKGSGMIRPDMATMLAFVTTDAIVEADMLQHSLESAVNGSFNSLNIDGCESTNDTVIVMASGASGVAPSREEFAEALSTVCKDLALQMAADAEGASRVVTIDVHGAASDEAARSLGALMADSALARASFYGGDPNWGRLVAALGTSPINISIDDVAVSYQGVVVCVNGAQTDYDEPKLLMAMENGDLSILVEVGSGQGRATIVTTDLTPEYVVFNGERS